MKFSVISTGQMAQDMVNDTVSKMNDVQLYGVASRSQEKARSFAERFGFEKYYESYEQLAEDDGADLVYIATPHTQHYKYAKMCLEKGRNVLLEKPFTMNASQAAELVELAKNNNCFLTEAIWTRYLPGRKIIENIIDEGKIGKVRSIRADLGYVNTDKARILDPALGGGAVLDLGVYTLHFALMLIDDKISELYSSAALTPDGVDLVSSVTLKFAGGAVAVLSSDITTKLDNRCFIYGEKGFLQIENMINPKEILRYDLNHELIEKYDVPVQITGYEYEIMACSDALSKGEKECCEIPHSETIRIMRLLDEIRSQWNKQSADKDL